MSSTPESLPPILILLSLSRFHSTKCQRSKERREGVPFSYCLTSSDYIIDNTMPMVKLANGNSNDGDAR